MNNPTTEETPAPDAAEVAGPEPPAPPAASQGPSELERFKDLAMRAQADFENFRKRSAREKEDAVKYANAALLERLLPVVDNLELGLEAARQDAQNAPILIGMEMVAKQLSDFLLAQGVEPVNAPGALFDPNVHEAVAQEESADVPEGHVIRQLRKGFKLRDRLLRPATVVVSRGSAQD